MQAEPVRGLRVAVTGASGFVGERLVRELVRRGAWVQGYGRRRQHVLAGAGYRAWDIAQAPLRDAPDVDMLIHCAGMVTDWGPRADFMRCHVDGTRNVLASFAQPCPVVYVSTASVYEPMRHVRLIDEQAPLARHHLNAYSETKALAESLVLARGQAIVLRPHAIYGPGDRVLLPRLLDAYRWGRLIAAGNGRNRISLTHVDNLVEALMLAVESLVLQRKPGIYNVADATPVCVGEALHAVLAASGRVPRVLYLPRGLAYAIGAGLECAHHMLGIRRAPRLTRYRVVHLADECTLDLRRAVRDLGYQSTRNLFDFLAAGGMAEAGQPVELRHAAEARSTSSRP